MAQSSENPENEHLNEEQAGRRPGVGDQLQRLADDVRHLPVLDPRSPDEIFGYDETGLPT